MKRSVTLPFIISLILVPLMSLSSGQLFAQTEPDFSDDYLTPPESVSEEILAPRHENVTLSNLSPNGSFFINTTENGLPKLSALAKPWHNIAGLQVDHQANRSRWMTASVTITGIEKIDARTGEAERMSTPSTATISGVKWSPEGDRVAYFAHYDRASHIYIADVESGRSERITQRPVLATLNTSFEWSGDGNAIFTVLLPRQRGPAPERLETPNAIKVRTTSSAENRLRTYQSLLEDRHDAELLEYYIRGQVARIDLENGDIEPIGEPGLIRNINPSPSGEHLIVQSIEKPFSYIVPYYSFAWTEEIWDLEGNVLTTLRTSETREGDPDAEELEDFNRRDIQWRPDGEGLSMLLKSDHDKEENGSSDSDEPEEEEPEDEPVTDRIMQWLPPFEEEDMTIVYETESEMENVYYNDSATLFFIEEESDSNEKLYAVFADEADTTYTLYDYDSSDFYENPGSLMEKNGALGLDVVRVSADGESVYLDGTQYFEDFENEAPRPFIDRVEIRTGAKERVFHSAEDVFEEVAAVLNDNLNELMLVRQSPDMLPDSWLYNRESGDMEKLTNNTDPNEAVTLAQRDRFKVTRADGFEFWMEVIMPRDWDGEPLPGLIWHYPREVDDQEDYDEGIRNYNINRYPRIGARSSDIMVKEGYAVLQPDWPITGERGSSNDNFVWSIVQNSTAVIDSAEARGYIDRHKMAIGGHSYGAFGTSNAMIHTSFFKAGIAGAGNYNRTLTPLGFQREPADLWRGQDRYMQMSPIFWADRLDGALLMYHSEADQNVGTWPTNSRRMFHALNGIGKDAALYMYPHEGHGPAAEETLLDLWTRWTDWLDYYVKEGGPAEAEE